MRVRGACHGQRTGVIGQAVVSFVLNRFAIVFLLHAGAETAALDHEVVDHTVKDGAVVEAAAGISQKIRC